MIQVFKREIKANFKSMLFWSLGMFVLVALCFYEYGAVLKSDTSIGAMFDMIPRVVRVMYGAGTLSLDTAQGYYACMFLWVTLISFTHAVLLGANIISKEERDRTSEFLFTKPIKRSTVITGKILAAIVNIIVIALIAWGTTLATFLPQIEEVGFIKEINITMLGMFFVQLVFLFIGFCISGFVKNHKSATKFAAISVIAAYFASVIIEMIGNVDFLNFLSPFRYFTAVSVMENGLNILYIILSAIVIIVTGYFGYVFWSKKDLNN